VFESQTIFLTHSHSHALTLVVSPRPLGLPQNFNLKNWFHECLKKIEKMFKLAKCVSWGKGGVKVKHNKSKF
jgi:hypothetical protein